VEDESKSKLMDFIQPQVNLPSVDDEGCGNKLSATQEEILQLIRSKLGSSTDRTKQETVSLFSFLDDDMNSAF
jgi:hypothetical protein